MRNGESAALCIRSYFPELHLRVVVVGRDTRINCNAAFGWLRQRGVAFKKTNVFLIPPAYTKTPHECMGLHCRFGRGFFEGSGQKLTFHYVTPSALELLIARRIKIPVR